MDINYIVLLVVAIVMALAYGLIGWAAAYIQSGKKFDLAVFIATFVYSIVVGIIAVSTGMINLDTLSNWQAIFSPMWSAYALIYTGLLYIAGKVFGTAASKLATVKIIPPTTRVDPTRKMDQETREKFFNDQSDIIRAGILNCVDQAEDAKTYRYAIAAGAWIYLVEFGEVTGAKHYWFRYWLGSTIVLWKPITSQCLENIRSTGKFPDYEDLY